jgi:hypothetical protein
VHDVKQVEPARFLRIVGERKAEGLSMMHHPVSRPAFEKSEFIEVVLRVVGGGLTIGLLIVLPALKILGLA